MENMIKTLIIITLIYYLIKGLIYLAFWQATYKIEENARASIAKKKRNNKVLEEIYSPQNNNEDKTEK